MYAALHPFCDVATARSAATRNTAGHPQLVLATTMLASSLAVIDGAVVNVGLSAIGHSLAADAAGLQWIINAYLLPLSALLLLGGTAGDRFGSRLVLVVGTAVFGFASLGFAFAPNLATLLAGRAIQGVGAAILLPNSLALLGQTFSGQAKGRTIGSGRGGGTRTTVATGVTAVALILLFMVVEKRRGDRAMIPLHLFASRIFVGLTLFTLLLYGALGSLFVLVPYVLIRGGGYSSAAAGAALLPLPLVISVTSPLIGGLSGRIGPRLLLAIGSFVAAGGFLLALRIGGTAGYWTEVLPAIFLIALGVSAVVAPLTTAVLSAVDVRHTGSASGLNSAVARAGGLVATALLGAVLSAEGEELWVAFHMAMIVAAATCAAAALSIFALDR